MLKGGGPTAPGVCTKCAAGQYAERAARGDDRFQCKTPNCGAGKHVTAGLLPMGTLKCEECEAGKYQNASGHAAETCRPLPPCGGGRTRAGATKAFAGWCVGCGSGPMESEAGRAFQPSGLHFPCAGRACIHYYRVNVTGSATVRENVASLRASPNFPLHPDESHVLRNNASFALHENDRADNYGALLEGYLKPPADGYYLFSVNSDDGSELWLEMEQGEMTKVLETGCCTWKNANEPTPLKGGRLYRMKVSPARATPGAGTPD